MFAALHEDIGLTAAQRTSIESLVRAKQPIARPKPDTTHATALATAIRAGTVDTSTFKLREHDATFMQDRIAESAKKLASLHATLTPEQRVKLVDAVAAKHAAGPGAGREGHRRPGAGAGPEAHDHGAQGAMGGLLSDLGLTTAQKDAIKTKLDALKPADGEKIDREAFKAKFETMKKDMDAKLQTFKGDTFDATVFVTPPAGAMKGPQVDRRGNELSVVVSVLDPAQREKLAQKIEQGPRQMERPAR